MHGASVRALHAVDLEVTAGQSLAIIGPSGCGKSTLLRALAGLFAVQEGSVLVWGEELRGSRKQTAFLLQDYGLLPWKDVWHNAELGLKIQGVPKKQRCLLVSEALRRVGLADFRRAYPLELSGGMRQRVALARALALQSDLLLMDEPLSALDAFLREDMQDMLLELWQEGGYTQILVTHSIEEAVFLGQRIVVMASNPGRIVAEIQNPDMGTHEYRTSERFFEQCNLVRHVLAEAVHTSKAADRMQGEALAVGAVSVSQDSFGGVGW